MAVTATVGGGNVAACAMVDGKNVDVNALLAP